MVSSVRPDWPEWIKIETQLNLYSIDLTSGVSRPHSTYWCKNEISLFLHLLKQEEILPWCIILHWLKSNTCLQTRTGRYENELLFCHWSFPRLHEAQQRFRLKALGRSCMKCVCFWCVILVCCVCTHIRAERRIQHVGLQPFEVDVSEDGVLLDLDGPPTLTAQSLLRVFS